MMKFYKYNGPTVHGNKNKKIFPVIRSFEGSVSRSVISNDGVLECESKICEHAINNKCTLNLIYMSDENNTKCEKDDSIKLSAYRIWSDKLNRSCVVIVREIDD